MQLGHNFNSIDHQPMTILCCPTTGLNTSITHFMQNVNCRQARIIDDGVLNNTF